MKAIIIDPSCYPKGGHNVDSCIRFAQELQKQGVSDVTVWLAGNDTKIRQKGLKSSKLPRLYLPLYEQLFESKISSRLFYLMFSGIRVSLGFVLDIVLMFVAQRVLLKKLKKLDKDKEYLFFFPSCDYFFASSLLKLLQKKAFAHSHWKIKLRFIHVMEWAWLAPIRKANPIFKQIKSFEKDRIVLTAEVKRYAKYLSNLTKLNIKEEPYPFCPKGTIKPYDKAVDSGKYASVNPFKIILLGRPRPDKGNLDLPEIARRSLSRFGMKVVFYAVSFSKKSRWYMPRHKQEALPNIRFQFGGYIPEEEYEAMLDAVDAVLFPYDDFVYWNRGSAVFFDAIEQRNSGIIIARGGLGFANSLEPSGSLIAYHTLEDLMNKIESLSNKSRREIKNMARQQRKNYEQWYYSL